jgi:tetratricopeptide (TPR) repeat protein
MERYADAVAVYDRALAVMPATGALYHNRGNALLELGRWDEAIACYRKALCFMPDFAEAYVTAATALQALRKPFEAMASCHRALAIDPSCAEAHWNLALALLQVGEFVPGWREFEWRWRKRGFTTKSRSFGQPMWDGSSLEGQTILVHAEQGFGDTFQFVRYLTLLAEQGGRVLLECPGSQKKLLAGVPGVTEVIATGEARPDFDCHLPIMSLPLRCETTLEMVPATVPYIFPPLETLACWAEKFDASDTLRVGLVWAGRKRPDPNRTCPLENFAPLADIPGVTFYSVQLENEMSGKPGGRQGLELVDLTADIEDFADTAALIANLDLVISIDTGVAHLSGALGKETWVLLPYAADWRWMLDREDSPWYPGMRLFRQQTPGNWTGVITAVMSALAEKKSAFQDTIAIHSAGFETAYADGLDLLLAGRLDAAGKELVAALLLDPRVPEIFNALGVLSREKGLHRVAGRFFRHAVVLDPNYVDGHINRGNNFFAENCFEDALEEYRSAVRINPKEARAHQNQGVVLQALGKFADAAASFQAALQIDPGYATARWNLAVLNLLTGNLAEGFREFEARFHKKDPVPARFSEVQPWDGSTFSGKTLLVHAEQGFGDTFQFLRYLPLVAERGGKIIFECQHESLRDILTISLRGTAYVYVRGEALPEAHLQVPLLSLPRIFGTTLDSIPSSVPYIVPKEQGREAWKTRLQSDKGFRVGLVWAGRPKPDPKRSASLAALAPLAAVPGTIYYSLQVGDGSDEALDPPAGMILRDYSAELIDFSATAALIANLDLVITIDSAVAHLSGALGTESWVLLPYSADWRWMTGRNDSPWYPAMRLFRQERPGDWSVPVAAMVKVLCAKNAVNGVF